MSRPAPRSDRNKTAAFRPPFSHSCWEAGTKSPCRPRRRRKNDCLLHGRVLSDQSLAELYKRRAPVSIGEALYGSFLIDSPPPWACDQRARRERPGHNAYLNDYTECGFIVAIVTSRGPLEGSGKPLFRDRLIDTIEDNFMKIFIRF